MGTTLIFTRFIFILIIEVRSFEINKCCPLGFHLNDDHICEQNSEEIVEDDLSWFPFIDIRNTRLENLTKVQEEEVYKWMYQPGTVGYGIYYNINVEYNYIHFIAENQTVTKVFNLITGAALHLIPVKNVCVDEMYTYDSEEKISTQLLGYRDGSFQNSISKCCSLNEIYNHTIAKCAETPRGWNNWQYWQPHNKSGELEEHTLQVAQFPNCSGSFLKFPARFDKCKDFIDDYIIDFSTNGSLKVAGKTLNSDRYCGEHTWHEGDIVYYNVFACSQPKTNNFNKLLYGIVFIIGGICLLLTVAISFLLPELRKRIHNKIAITHNVTLMIAHFVWGTVQLISYTSIKVSIQTCTILGLLIQFTFLGSLFWLNAMCINMSSTFRATQAMTSRSARSESRRYAIYSIYAWGSTAVVSIFTIAVEFADEPPYGLLRPGFTCFCDFARHTISVFIYFYGPMVVILLFNLVLYIFTTWKIMNSIMTNRKDSKKTGGASLDSEVQRLILYSKLFFLMGLTWMTEILGWAFGGDENTIIETMLDVINLLRAVFIFVIFTCKRSVYKSLRKRFISTKRQYQEESTTSQTAEVFHLSTAGSTFPSVKKIRNVVGLNEVLAAGNKNKRF